MRSAARGTRASITPCMKIRLSTGTHGGLGEGRFQLLEAIAREGSLKAAAAALGMSYRKAWGDLNDAEQALGVKLIEKDRGGAKHGGTVLTSAGQRLVRGYARLQAEMEKTLKREFTRHLGGWMKPC